MRAASLHRYLPSPYAVRVAAVVLLLTFALIVLLAFGAAGVAAADGSSPSYDWNGPFRWR
jgi:hypothetical protein